MIDFNFTPDEWKFIFEVIEINISNEKLIKQFCEKDNDKFINKQTEETLSEFDSEEAKEIDGRGILEVFEITAEISNKYKDKIYKAIDIAKELKEKLDPEKIKYKDSELLKLENLFDTEVLYNSEIATKIIQNKKESLQKEFILSYQEQFPDVDIDDQEVKKMLINELECFMNENEEIAKLINDIKSDVDNRKNILTKIKAIKEKKQL